MSDSNPPPTDALTAATQMVKNGRLDQARDTLMQYLMKNPSSEQAWLLMSYVLPDTEKQKDCLERVLKINPNNTVAQSKLAHLLGRRTEELFKKKPESSAPVALPKAEAGSAPHLFRKPAPEPMPEPEPIAFAEPEAAIAPPEIPSTEEEPATPKSPPKRIAAPRLSMPSVRWSAVATAGSVIVILVLLAVILYLGVIGPLIQSFSAVSPTATPEPVVFPTYPPEWTQTPTRTKTPIPPTPTPTETESPTPELTPSETIIP
jgi:hypothetical protein